MTSTPLQNAPFFLEGIRHREHACLLLHGLGGGVYEMQWLGEFLHRQGMTVQGISYPGHDAPAPKMPHSTWAQWYGHILQTYETLRQTYDRVSVVGFSTGCPLALQLTLNLPPHRLVLLAPYLALRSYWYHGLPLEAYVFSIGHFIPDLPRYRLPVRDVQIRQMAEQVVFYRTFSLPAVRSANALIQQVKPQIPQIQVPTLMIQSPQDSIVAPQGAEYLYQHLGSSQKRLVWVHQSDHILPLDHDRAQVFQETADFLLQTPIPTGEVGRVRRKVQSTARSGKRD